MNALKTVGWGLYLASSWTWCIGMFLPIILLERYGWQGFFMFAIPTIVSSRVLGTAARADRTNFLLVEC